MKKIILSFIELYKKIISPVISAKGYHCKFYPSCSDYTKQAIEKYGIFKGVYLGIKRIVRCHPFSKGGYDPLK
ncbi:MAG: membrane protein insertion efficiency factor YidD [Clostridia bacterium]|nr:membrane protein insertion efficiency factor YidD [Clostridia bacterium]